jgi:hypothetical protein
MFNKNMTLRCLDYLSPKISLFHNGRKSHASNVGGITTILMIILSGLYVFYLIYSIAQHKFSNFWTYKNYLNDVGQYNFNDTGGIFHFFQLFDYQNHKYGEYNSKYVRIIMSRINYRNYGIESIDDNEHWVYDSCREGVDNKNIPKDVFEENPFFYQGACLRFYFDISKKKYFPIDDKENFKYPYLIHGSGRNDNLLLETVIEKCNNNSITNKLLGPCGEKKDIEAYIEKHKAIYFHLLENQIDTGNYKKPIYKYIYSISGSLDPNNVPVNNVNLMPFLIELKKGIFLPYTLNIVTYLFDDNRKATFSNNDEFGLLAIFDYWMINTCQVIKGGYNNLYDILPNIGGIIQLIYYIFFSINYFYNNYTILSDTNFLFFNIFNKETDDKDNCYNRKLFANYVNSIREEISKKRRNSELKRTSKLLYKNKKEMIKNQKKGVTRTDVNIYQKKMKDKIIDNNKNEFFNNNNISNSNDLIIDLPKKKNYISKNSNIIQDKQNILCLESKYDENKKNKEEKKSNENSFSNQNKKKDFLYYQFLYQLQEFFYHKNSEIKTEPLNQIIISRFISFCNYLMSFTGHIKKKRIFFILNKIREKIISEENLFKTKINLYHLERYFNIREIGKIDVLELYNN